MKEKRTATALAILAAALYAINVPLSKLLLAQVQPTMMAAFLYLGAGLGMLLYTLGGKALGHNVISQPLTVKELPYTAAMVVLDIAAPILLMLGIARANAANASLLGNFEIVATSLIACFLFRETVSGKLFFAILLVTLASIILSFEGQGSFQFGVGSLLVLAAASCWGLENNCTRMLSSKSSVEIVIIKGCFSGLGSLIIALCIGQPLPKLLWAVLVMLLGFVSYGLSINFYIMAQKHLGAAQTSAFYSVAPFLGVGFGILLLGERPQLQFYLGFAVMLAAAILMAQDTLQLRHSHAFSHTHLHLHREGLHISLHCHEHAHEAEHTHMGSGQSHGALQTPLFHRHAHENRQ